MIGNFNILQEWLLTFQGWNDDEAGAYYHDLPQEKGWKVGAGDKGNMANRAGRTVVSDRVATSSLVYICGGAGIWSSSEPPVAIEHLKCA